MASIFVHPWQVHEQGTELPALRRDLFNETTPHERDLLAHGPLVEELADVLQSERTPLTVMVNGPWGSGKTSFLRALARHIQTRNRVGRWQRRSATVWFDPWEHEDAPNIIVPFLNRLRQEAYRDDEARRAEYSEQEKSLLSELLWMLVPDELHHLMPGTTVNPHSLRKRVRGLFQLRRRRLQSIVDSAFPLHRGPQEQLSARVRQQFVEYIRAILARGYDRVVILLDDLDRCQPHVMRKLLELVKVNLLGAAGRDRHAMAELEVAFVFAIDHQTLIQAVNEPKSATPTADYARYLDKIFDLRIDLPRVVEGDMQRLLSGLLDTRHPDVRTRMSRAIASSPSSPDTSDRYNTYQAILVALVEPYDELRSARFLRRIVNKLMVFAFVEGAERAIVNEPGCLLDPDLDRTRHNMTDEQSAARLIVAWQVFGQAWITTRAFATKGDGIGLTVLLDLWCRTLRPASASEVLDVTEKRNVSPSGIRFLVDEIIRRLDGGQAVLERLRFGAEHRTATFSSRQPTDITTGVRTLARHLTRLDRHVCRNLG